jgi:hypothetical protein
MTISEFALWLALLAVIAFAVYRARASNKEREQQEKQRREEEGKRERAAYAERRKEELRRIYKDLPLRCLQEAGVEFVEAYGECSVNGWPIEKDDLLKKFLARKKVPFHEAEAKKDTTWTSAEFAEYVLADVEKEKRETQERAQEEARQQAVLKANREEIERKEAKKETDWIERELAKRRRL